MTAVEELNIALLHGKDSTDALNLAFQMADELDRLRALRPEEQAKKAARYDWLVENIEWLPAYYNGAQRMCGDKKGRFDFLWVNDESDLGKAIDAEMLREPQLRAIMADRRGKKQRRLYKARQKARGARIVRHRLIGGRTGGKAAHQRKSGKRGKGGGGKQRYEIQQLRTQWPDFSLFTVRKVK